ncbi:twisted gastrulation protein homolog 1 isoform X3 [Kogia breviceps]|uniref:twisted gastrulation protein homolog 1 isoform X3 n=1 Tax=Kogia breviceps TaxID=27615 RepID=UPI0034D31FBB
MKSRSVVMLTVAILVFLTWVPVSLSCNKALCASDVSKCLIQELCQCRPGEGNCSCCKECMLCLGTLWDECCDCVGTITYGGCMARKTRVCLNVEAGALTETVNQPHHQNVSVPSNNVHAPYSSDKEHMCTVVYFDDCMSIHQCKISCESMGASKYRWFHNACWKRGRSRATDHTRTVKRGQTSTMKGVLLSELRKWLL